MLFSCNSYQEKSNILESESGTFFLPLSNIAALTQVTQHSIFLLYLLCFLFSMVVSPRTGVGGFKHFPWRFVTWYFFWLSMQVCPSLLQLFKLNFVCVLWARVPAGCPWVAGGVLCKQQSQVTAAGAQRGPRPARNVCWDLGAF